jgi:hypothetical protein
LPSPAECFRPDSQGIWDFSGGKNHAWSGKAPAGFDDWCITPGADYLNPKMNRNGKVSRMAGYISDIITEQSIAWLEQRETSRPFLLVVQHIAWLPAEDQSIVEDARINEWLASLHGTMRLMICRYQGAQLVQQQAFDGKTLTTPTARWKAQIISREVADALECEVAFTLVEGQVSDAAVAVAFDLQRWQAENYLMVPAIVYNANRYPMIGNGYNPRYPEYMWHNKDLPLTFSRAPGLALKPGQPGALELQTGNTACPAICAFSQSLQRSLILLTHQKTRWGDNGLILAEDAPQDTLRLAVTAPGVRRYRLGFGSLHPSGDRGATFKAGDTVTLRFTFYSSPAQSIPDLLRRFMRVRKAVTGPTSPRNLTPMSQVLDLVGARIDRARWWEQGGYYRPENANWMVPGWVGGPMMPYVMLAKGDDLHARRAARSMDVIADRMAGKAGFYYWCYAGPYEGGALKQRGAKGQGWPAQVSMVRASADLLHWYFQVFHLYQALGREDEIKASWRAAARQLADGFVKLWEENGEFGQYVHVDTGKLWIYNSSAGVPAIGGLALASEYFNEPRYLAIAQSAAETYYRRDLYGQGLTAGHCGDISQDADAESAFGFCRALMTLHEKTGDRKWLRYACDVAALCSTWVQAYNYDFPPPSDFARLRIQVAGAVWASVQNKHAAPGVCTCACDCLFRLSRATGDAVYAELLRDIIHAHAEVLETPVRRTHGVGIGTCNERIQTSDAEGPAGRGKMHRAANGWTEANAMLMAWRNPGIYLQTDTDQCYVFDHVTAKILQREADGVTLSIFKDITPVEQSNLPRYDGDWLVRRPDAASTFEVKLADDGRSATLVLANGLVRRTFYLGDNLVCFSLRQEPAGLEFLRSIKPEATIEIAGKRYRIGGMRFPSMAAGQKDRGRSPFVADYFLNEWLDKLVGDPHAFQLVRVTTGVPQAWLKWQPMKPENARPWPPEGLRVSMHYAAPKTVPEVEGLQVTVHYEIYDDLPVIGKWLSFANAGERPITLDRTLIEELAFADENANKIFIESEYNHFRATPIRWYVDPAFQTDSGPVYTERMSDYRLRYWSQQELDEAPNSYHKPMNRHPEWQGEYRSRSLLQVQYPVGPAKTLAKGESWSTFRSWLLVQSSMDEDRKGMARQALYRTIMPWTQENLIYMHVLRYRSNEFRMAVDQAAACGMDMVILTFGSGFNMMSTDPKYIAQVKADFDYARGKGIKAGGYILFSSSRSYGAGEHDVRPAAYGRSLCLGSAFGDQYFKQLIGFMKKTGVEVIETDGPYHGFGCDRTDHPGHKGQADSHRVNWEQQAKFYHMCMDEGIYIISPDWYFASGVRKMPMGYKESNWTLPRAQQTLVARQNIYDGTWWRTPSMSYHALPLTPVYGGGPESTMEPLSQHLDQYDRVLGQYFGMGIMACYRGTRLYDTDKTKAVVTGWIDFYHRHEPILLSPIVHVRRPDGRDLDCMMHVNAALPEKGLAFVWNPTDKPIIRAVQLPLYYTGIAHEAEISVHAESSDEVQPKVYELDREYGVKVLVTVPARGYVWLLIKDATPTQAGRAAAFIERLQAGESQTIVTMGTSLTGGGSPWVTPFAGWLSNLKATGKSLESEAYYSLIITRIG